MAYPGTVLVVSHDRTFLNNVVTSSIVFESGQVREYAGGYDDWLRQRSVPNQSAPPVVKPVKKATSPVATEQERRLSFKEKRELAELPAMIETLESQISALHESMAATDYYQQSGEILAADKAQLSDWQEQLSVAVQRWCELEELAS